MLPLQEALACYVPPMGRNPSHLPPTLTLRAGKKPEPEKWLNMAMSPTSRLYAVSGAISSQNSDFMPFTNHPLWSPNDQNDTHSKEKQKEQVLSGSIRSKGWKQIL